MSLENLTPITRLEYYLAKIRGDEVVTPEARTRLEHYLNKIAGNTSEVIPEPKTRLEFYLAALAGADVTVPEPKTRLEEYVKGTIDKTGDVPDPITRLEYYLAALAGMTIEVPEVQTRLEYWLTRENSSLDLDYALKFSSPTAFTLTTYDGKGHWTDTMEYYTSGDAWNEWEVGDNDAIEALTAELVNGEYVIYLRGTNNSMVGGATNSRFVFTGSNISCTGNIETILDYATVKAGNHPRMNTEAFVGLFSNTPIITAPTLGATTLASNCYDAMFMNCTALTSAPALPATTMADQCYFRMFKGCTSLTTAPTLTATTLAEDCYNQMFMGCTSLTTAPALPATTLAPGCYLLMFSGCTSLTATPELPAETLAANCYETMFQNCSALTTLTHLPATTLAEDCYRYMFQNCTSLTQLPPLRATTLADGCYNSMFDGCTKIKISATQTEEYQKAYNIPTIGTGTAGTESLDAMFIRTGGTFTDTPEINTTYWTSNTVLPLDT